MLAALLALFAASATPIAAQQVDPTAAVVDSFERARAAGDVNAAIGQFADDAVVTVQAGRSSQVFAGRDQIRAYLLNMAMPSRALMRSAYRIDGPFVRWTERDEAPQQMVDSMVQATIRAGRITSLIYQQSEPYGVQSAPARAAANQPAQVPSLAWAAALASTGLLLVLLCSRPRRRASRSELDGRLLAAMRQSSARERLQAVRRSSAHDRKAA
jgi:hypothetical protein